MVVAWHALLAGGAGTLVLGVMTRATLGHTGRPLVAQRSIAIAYGLVSLAALARVVNPLLDDLAAEYALISAATLWTAAYLIFVIVYLPILTRPRVDGREG